jgi:exonuclease VII small subunit
LSRKLEEKLDKAEKRLEQLMEDGARKPFEPAEPRDDK